MKRTNSRSIFFQFVFALSFIVLLVLLIGLVLINSDFVSFTKTNLSVFLAAFLFTYFIVIGFFLYQARSKLSISLKSFLSGYDSSYKNEIETRLLESEDKFRKLFDNANDAIFLWLINESTKEIEKLLDVNKAAVDTLGYSRKEMEKMLPNDFLVEEIKSKAPLALKRLFTEGSARFETVFNKKNGERLDVEIDSRCFMLVNEKLVLSIIRDISQRKRIEETLKLTKFCVDNASIGIIRTDDNAKILEANGYICNLLGYSEKELCEKLIFEIDPNYSKKFWENRLEVLHKNGSDTYETELIAKNENRVPVAITNTLIRYNDKEYSWSFIRDIAEIVESRIELNLREHLLTEAQRIAKFGYYIYDFTTRIWECSEEVDEILGIEKSFEKTFDKWLTFVDPEYYNDLKDYLNEFIQQKKEKFDNEYRIIRQNDSERRWIHCLGKVEYDKNDNQKYLIGTVQDVTDRRIAENKMKESLHEKEILLKEIHHRVKNNLQVVSSLLFLQSQQLKNKELVELLKISQNRVRTMALIHEKLYQSKDLNKIDFGQYISSLILALKESFSVDENKIMIDVKTESILLDIDIAVPCGLIVNELIANSIKHAFKNVERGLITIEAKYENDNYHLIIKDNGIGLSDKIKIDESQTLGLRIVYNLVRQLRGEYKIENDNGTRFIIIFPKLS